MNNLGYKKPVIKIQSVKNLLPDAPDACYLEVTYSCNLRCQFCYNDKKRIESPSFEKIKKILKLLKENAVLEITLTGGEFFTVKYWKEIVEHANKLGFLMNICSNGTLISQLPVKSLSSLIKINSLGISMHSVNTDVYERITGVKGSFAKMIKGLERLKKNDIPFGLTYTVTADNHLDFYSDIKKLVQRYNIPIRRININRLVEVGSAETNWKDISGINYQELFNQAEQVKKELKISVRAHPFPLCLISKEHQSNIMFCGAGRNVFTVDWQGNIRPCPLDQRIAGNIFSNSLQAIFRSSMFLRNLRENKWLPEKCGDCPNKKCIGGCYMSSKQDSANNIMPDYLLMQDVKKA